MSNPYAIAEELLMAVIVGGEEHAAGQQTGDIVDTAGALLAELFSYPPEVAAGALIALIDLAIDCTAEFAQQDRITVAKWIVDEARQQRLSREAGQ